MDNKTTEVKLEKLVTNTQTREFSFILLLVISWALAVVIRLLGQFRFKKELLSIIGIAQLLWFCGWDLIHFVVMTAVGTILIKIDVFGPRAIFCYCFLHRVLFSSSKYLGLHRDESNLANACMFIATMKTICLAYEVSDYRNKKIYESKSAIYKTKWINIDHEPSTYDIICYMTCYSGIFTGPVFRYKTYNDMLTRYLNVPVRKEIWSRSKEFLLMLALYILSPYNLSLYKSESFYKHGLVKRLYLMAAVALTQGLKYSLAWITAETVCLLVGLGGYPTSTNAIPGMGPLQEEPAEEESAQEKKFGFDTICTMKFYSTLSALTIRGALQTWNHCTQWWLAYFVYSSSIFPKSWKTVRALAVLATSAILHGIKIGYFVSFLQLIVCLMGEELWSNIELCIPWRKVLLFYKLIYWIFGKSFVLFYLITIFLLQDGDQILPFCISTLFYGHFVPLVYLFIGLVIGFVVPSSNIY